MHRTIVVLIFDTRMIVFTIIICRKHTARSKYTELIRELHVDQEYDLVEHDKKDQDSLHSIAPNEESYEDAPS